MTKYHNGRRLLVFLAVFFSCAGLLTAQERPPREKKPEFQAVIPPGVKALKDIEYVAQGGPKRSLDLYLPEKANARLPVVIWIHGGAWRSGGKERWSPAFNLPTRGYAVAMINYRYSVVDNAPFPNQIYDCKAVIRWVRAHATEYGFDPDHVGLWGHSAGGHLVAFLGLTGNIAKFEGDEGNPKYSTTVQAVCDWSGIIDIVSEYQKNSADPKNAVVQLLGGKDMSAATEAKAMEASPLTYVKAGMPPFLIMHGTADKTVAPSHSEKLSAALKSAGVECTYIQVPDKDHGIGGPELESQVADFFDRHLKPNTVARPAK